MKKLIATFAVLGLFSFQAAALPSPQGAVEKAVAASTEEITPAQQQATIQAINQALMNLAQHIEENSLSKIEEELVYTLYDNDFARDIYHAHADFEFLFDMLFTEGASEEETNAAKETMDSWLLDQAQSMKSVSNFTDILLFNQEVVPMEEVNSSIARASVLLWLFEVYGLEDFEHEEATK